MITSTGTVTINAEVGCSGPTHDLGRMAAELLERRLADPLRPSATVLLPPRLEVRASCGTDADAGPV